MIQIVPKLIDIEQFITEYGDNEHYELIDGELISMEPTGTHEQIAALISRKLNVEIDRRGLPFFIPHRCLIKLLETQTAFRPDIIVLDERELNNEPLWQNEPVITQGKTIKFIAEIVSSNWQNDYARKIEDYAFLGVKEYWIVDYLGIGGREYIGYPKQPSITICQLENEQYKKQLFQGNTQLISSVFPELQLNTNQIFNITLLK